MVDFSDKHTYKFGGDTFVRSWPILVKLTMQFAAFCRKNWYYPMTNFKKWKYEILNLTTTTKRYFEHSLGTTKLLVIYLLFVLRAKAYEWCLLNLYKCCIDEWMHLPPRQTTSNKYRVALILYTEKWRAITNEIKAKNVVSFDSRQLRWRRRLIRPMMIDAAWNRHSSLEHATKSAWIFRHALLWTLSIMTITQWNVQRWSLRWNWRPTSNKSVWDTPHLLVLTTSLISRLVFVWLTTKKRAKTTAFYQSNEIGLIRS